MALLYPIAASQVDAKSPIDDALMQSVKYDLEDLSSQVVSKLAFDYEFKVNGKLNYLPAAPIHRLDGALVAKSANITRARLYLEQPGTSGALTVDVRKYTTPNTPITALTRQYSGAIQSITQIAPAIATQSISRYAPQISTQSISLFKSTINVSSIIILSSGLVRYNLASQPDSDWQIGDSVTFASCTSAANNITTTIVEINQDNGENIVVSNGSGVAQTSAAGTAQLNAWKYTYTNAVDTTAFIVGQSAVFASHTAGANNGTFAIYAVNSGGNNVVVKNSAGVAQAGVAGTCDTSIWKYVYSSSVASDFVAGEYAAMASHTTGANNGNFLIMYVNSGGNNICVYNTAGVAQGGVAGNANTLRWIYALPTDPTSSFSVGQNCVVTSATTDANNGTFAVKQINRSGTNNLIIYNTAGVTQAGVAGTLAHSRMLIKFASDQSSIYTTSSSVELFGVCSSLNMSGQYRVLEVNRGGGANYNVVVDSPNGVEQASPAGRITLESKSLFNTPLSLTMATATKNSTDRDMKYTTFTSSGDFTAQATLAVGDLIGISITAIPNGAPANVVVQLG